MGASGKGAAQARSLGDILPRRVCQTGLSTGSSAERLLPADPAERIALARRYVADRCLYGVDINPMAVEMAKLSLWLITLQRDRPFTFLDHALKCGDSLLGVSKTKQIENFTLRTDQSEYSSIPFAALNLFRYVEEASVKRRSLEDLPSNDHSQIETKNRLHAEAEAAIAKVKALADCLIALELRGLDGEAYENARDAESAKVQSLMARDADASLKSPLPHSQSALASHASDQLRGRRAFHWAVEFPEVFGAGGFDAVIGNPPFSAVRLFAAQLGDDYTRLLYSLTPEAKGNIDLSTFFLRKAHSIASGNIGLILTNSISQGANKDAAIQPLVGNSRIYRAWHSLRWPGTANVFVSQLHITKHPWSADCVLDEKPCHSISSELRPSEEQQDPFSLTELPCVCFRGSDWNGDGFLVEADFVKEHLRLEPAASEFLFPCLNARDYCDNHLHAASRWVVFFRNLDLDDLQRRVPQLLSALKQRVYEERSQSTDDKLRQNWWIFRRATLSLYEAAWRDSSVFVVPFTGKYVSFGRVSSKQIFANALNVFAGLRWDGFAVLQSGLHEAWVFRYCSTMKTDIRYAPSDLFETFPFPEDVSKAHSSSALIEVGARYHQFRDDFMASNREGLTDTYNRFHDRGEQSADIARLRALHVEMDQAVAAAYGWNDLDLGHGFHATKQGERYTLSEPARRTVLDRLLALNHQRYAEEVKAGLHDKKKPKPKATQAKKQVKATGAERQLPDDMRLPASEAPLYTANLILSLLSEAGGGLKMSELAEAFYLVTNPSLMLQKAKGADKELAKAWASRWNEPATPDWLLPTLRIMGPGNISAESDTEDDPLLELLDGPKPHAHDDLAYDAWLALRVMRSGKARVIEPGVWQEVVHERKAIFATA
jgi:hypothetical protein